MISMLHWFRMAATAATFSAAIACAGRPPSPAAEPDGAAAPAPARSTPATSQSSPDWLAVDSANRTATLTLEVTAGQNTPSALINGYRNGEARIVVPVGWTITWNWRNRDAASPHSLVVMVQREKVPLEGGRPAFSNAMTRMVTEGLPPVQTDQTTFVAEDAGWYWLMCGVPGHALAGEWIELRVDPEAKLPSIQLRSRT
jgi:sulfocyanin SoxE-like protein